MELLDFYNFDRNRIERIVAEYLFESGVPLTKFALGTLWGQTMITQNKGKLHLFLR